MISPNFKGLLLELESYIDILGGNILLKDLIDELDQWLDDEVASQTKNTENHVKEILHHLQKLSKEPENINYRKTLLELFSSDKASRLLVTMHTRKGHVATGKEISVSNQPTASSTADFTSYTPQEIMNLLVLSQKKAETLRAKNESALKKSEKAKVSYFIYLCFF